MAKARILGYKRVDYTSKKTGNPVLGYSLFYGAENPKENVIGLETGDMFMNDERIKGVMSKLGGDEKKLVNAVVEITYNKRGQVDDVTLV